MIYTKADRLLKQYNPCNIHIDITTNKLVCNNKCMCIKNGEKLCCKQCKHLKTNGCTIKSLGCKVGGCFEGHSWDTMNRRLRLNLSPEFIKQMDRLMCITDKYNINQIREEILI